MPASLPGSLSLDDLRALLGLLETQDTLSPSLQIAGSKLQAQAQALGFRRDAESFLLTPMPTPVQGHFSFRSEVLGTPQAQTITSLQGISPLIIRIPARRPRSPSSDRNESRHSDDSILPDLQPVPRTAPRRLRRRVTASGAPACKRGAVRPPARKVRSSKKGLFSSISNQEGVDEEDRNVIAAPEAQQAEELDPSLGGDHTRQSLQLLASCSPFPENLALPPIVKTFLLTITTACNEILASKEANKATRLIEGFEGCSHFMKRLSSVTAEDSLENLVTRCSTAEHNVALSDFFYILCTIQLKVRIME